MHLNNDIEYSIDQSEALNRFQDFLLFFPWQFDLGTRSPNPFLEHQLPSYTMMLGNIIIVNDRPLSQRRGEGTKTFVLRYLASRKKIATVDNYCPV